MSYRKYLCVVAAWLITFFAPMYLPAPDNSLWYPLQAVYSMVFISALVIIAIVPYTLIFVVLESLVIFTLWLAWLDHGQGGGYYERGILEFKKTINAFELILLFFGLRLYGEPGGHRNTDRLVDFRTGLSQRRHSSATVHGEKTRGGS